MMGHSVAEIHSNRSQGQRRAAMSGFKSGRYRILIATDIAARGIDVSDIELVVNFDLPDASEDYVHRIGRTGRAGKKGRAISFATPNQRREIHLIERLIKKNLPISKLPELPQQRTATPPAQPRSPHGTGPRHPKPRRSRW
jgi:ATP-dependent RNA helicase RhlE